MSYQVYFTEKALDDLKRLFSFLEEIDRQCAHRAVSAFEKAFILLRDYPWSCRQVGEDPSLRELIVRFGRRGYVCLFSVLDDDQIWILAVRHQRQGHYP